MNATSSRAAILCESSTQLTLFGEREAAEPPCALEALPRPHGLDCANMPANGGRCLTRSVPIDDALRAVALLGTRVRSTTTRDIPAWVMRRYLGRATADLDRHQRQGLMAIASTSCAERAPQCDQCHLRSFCVQPPVADLKHSPLRFLDLFCGAGGLSLGLESHGFSPCFAVDHDEAALQTYLANRPGLPPTVVRLADLTTLSPDIVPSAPLVIGGPPCQGFSNANKQRLSDDPRNRLYKRFLQIAASSGARVCLIENVPGMAKFATAVFRDMADIGMTARLCEVDAANLGYPQYRRRIFWIGIKGMNVADTQRAFRAFERALATRRVNHSYVLKDAIGDLPGLSAKTARNATHVESAEWGFAIAKPMCSSAAFPTLINDGVYEGPLLNHRTKYNNARDIEIYGRLAPGEGSEAESIKDIMPYRTRTHVFKDKFFKLHPERPSKTITAHMYYDCHMYIHPNQARGLTPREAARVQGFPDHYRFLGYPNEWYRQIGNAVSPLVAWHVGRALASLFHDFPELAAGD